MKRILLGGAALAALLALAPLGAKAATDEQKKDAAAIVDKNAQTIWDIGDSIYYFGEIGMQEFESTKLLKDTLDAAGFKVELGGAGMPTNLWAEYGSGQPQIVIVTRDRRAARRHADAAANSTISRWCRARPATWRATTPMAASPPPRLSPSSR